MPPADCRTVRIVGGGWQLLVVSRADLAAGSDHPARKRQNDASNLADGLDGRLGRLERHVRVLPQDKKVAAADPLLDAELLLDEELAFHHRNAPLARTGERSTGLVLVAEVPHVAADDHAFGSIGQAVEAGSRRAREDGLANAVEQAMREPVGVEPEHQCRRARPAIRRLLW